MNGGNIEVVGECSDESGTMSVLVSGNEIDAGRHGVKVELEGDLASDTITVDVSDNGEITSGDDAVDLEYCKDSGGCDASSSTINFFVNNNLMITGDDQGVDITIDADDTNAPDTSGIGSDNLHANVEVNGNGPITGLADQAAGVAPVTCDSRSASSWRRVGHDR